LEVLTVDNDTALAFDLREHPRRRTAQRLAALPPIERPAPTVNTGVAGAISELLVSADLLRRGLPVFRAVSAAAPCDLIVLRDGQALRVEVRSGTYGREVDGLPTIYFPLGDKDRGRFDVLAVVVGDVVRYLPDPFGDSLPARWPAGILSRLPEPL
jgi:hypothetical protein